MIRHPAMWRSTSWPIPVPPHPDRLCFSSAILPKWARRSRSLDALLPVLYLRGVSTGDFQEALSALLGKDAPNLSPAVITRLTATWADEYARWQARDLSARRYVYVWADGVYLQARMEEQAECMLVLIGATPEGKKELVGFQVGVRESAQSWREVLIDAKRRGLSLAPEIAVGDGALGFWKALDEVFPGTRHQRCWHSTPCPPSTGITFGRRMRSTSLFCLDGPGNHGAEAPRALGLDRAGDHVAKSGEEDAISAALPFPVAPRLRRPRTPVASLRDLLFSVVRSTPPRNGNRLPRPVRPTPARRHVRA